MSAIPNDGKYGLTFERANEALSYDPDIGIFRWKIMANNNSVRVGNIAGNLIGCGYWKIALDGHGYLAHRLAWLMTKGEWPQGQIDHINRTRSDNRWENLRCCTQPQNSANSKARSTNKTGFKGVYYHKAGKRYAASICHQGTNFYLGLFDTPEAAHAAYCMKAAELHGEFHYSGAT